MYQDYLILGGAGLVGLQVCRHISRKLDPRRIVVASLLEQEAKEACEILHQEFGDRISYVPAWGNLFVPTDLAEKSRVSLLSDAATRRRLLKALYDDFDSALKTNHLVVMIRQHRPEVIVDCVNTATGVSYQDVFDGAAKVREWIDKDGFDAEGVPDLEAFLLSQSSPQMIRHVRFVHRATTDYRTRVYLKVGTTGTGGMGLNIPYTHSEDKPSKKLLAKTEAAFGHTGLLFLLARTPDAPIVKEIKPAAMIGYRGVRIRKATDKHGNSDLYRPQETSLDKNRLELRQMPRATSAAASFGFPWSIPARMACSPAGNSRRSRPWARWSTSLPKRSPGWWSTRSAGPIPARTASRPWMPACSTPPTRRDCCEMRR
jgi:hypothetical protein